MNKKTVTKITDILKTVTFMTVLVEVKGMNVSKKKIEIAMARGRKTVNDISFLNLLVADIFNIFIPPKVYL